MNWLKHKTVINAATERGIKGTYCPQQSGFNVLADKCRSRFKYK
jgi:hypothetical protein